MKRTVSVLLCGLLGLALGGCFEDPVEETLLVRFTEQGQLAVHARVELHWLDDGSDNQTFFERMLGIEAGLMEGWSPWHRRFERLAELGGDSVEGDGGSWERAAGRLVRWEHWALAVDPAAALATMFSDTPVQPQYAPLPHGGELSFFAVGGDRATRAERDRVENALEDWSRSLAGYLQTTVALWSYLDANPRRAVTVVRGMFEDMADVDVELTDLERRLVQANSDASDRVLTIFELPEDESSTLQEASRRVFDPFPARLVVEVPGRVVAAEGFVPVGLPEGNRETRSRGEASTTRSWAVPPVSLWDAYRAIEGVWVSPDPLLTRVRHLMESGADEEDPLDVDAFLSQDFFYAAAPDRVDVLGVVLDALAPLDSYRLEWRQ